MAEAALQGDGRLPLYQRLAETLRAEVTGGIRKPGDPVPSENDLAGEYGLSVGTVRQALSELVKDGILERFHGKGTFIRRPKFDTSLFRFFRFRDASGEWKIPESRILKRDIIPVPSYVARNLGIKEGADAINMSRLRLLDNVPVLAEEIWLSAKPFSAFMEMPAGEIGDLLYPVYDKLCGKLVASAEEALSVETAKPEISRILRLDAAAPVVVIDRLAKDYGNNPIEWRRSRGRADLFHYQMEIR